MLFVAALDTRPDWGSLGHFDTALWPKGRIAALKGLSHYDEPSSSVSRIEKLVVG